MKKILIKLFIFVILLTLFNASKCYAISSKEDIEIFKEYREDYRQKQMKKGFQGREYKDAIYWFKAEPKTIDSETGKIYYGDGIGWGRLSPNKGDLWFENLIIELFTEYFDKNLSENLTDEERLLGYFISNCFPYTRGENFKDGDDIEIKISAFVLPASEKTIWAKNKEKVYAATYGKGYCLENNEPKVILEGYNTDEYYIRFSKQNEKYEVAFIDTMPEGYSDFVERMKTHGIDLENIDYAKLINSKSETEIIAEAVQKENFEAEKIIKTKSRINLFVISVCSFGIIVIIIVNINYIKKLKKRS